ncbi:MAG: DMT family transporter [Actinomycetota bacterium]
MARHLSPNARGAAYLTVGSIAAVVNDGLVRLAVEDGVDVYQALFLRGCGMIVILDALRRGRGERLDRQLADRPLLVRIAAEVVVAAAFFTAIVHVEFATAHTVLMAAPFAVTVVAARLGEPVTRRRYVLVTIGFVGVVAVVQPTSAGFSPWVLLVVAAAGALVVREFATRSVARATSPVTIALLTSVALTALTGALSIITGWGAVTARASVSLALACICLMAGYLLSIEAVRIGDLSVSAPFRYTTVLGAVVVGLAFFGEIPGTLTIVGCALIFGAGALSARDEAVQSRRQSYDRDAPAGPMSRPAKAAGAGEAC